MFSRSYKKTTKENLLILIPKLLVKSQKKRTAKQIAVPFYDRENNITYFR
jgi:hypothetical protein